jgi:hypothetical protein
MKTVARLFACLVTTMLPLSAFANESVYTDFPLQNNHCKATHSMASDDDQGGDSVSMYCPGWKKYQVLYKEGDGRVSVHYGYLSKKIVDSYWESFGPFSSAAEKIEWRVDDKGLPVAAIHRYFLANIDEQTGMPSDALRGQVLVISKVGQPKDKSGCVAGLVDALANKDANEVARKVADEIAPTFRCERDAATYHGKRGDKAPDLSASFGQ